MLTRILIVWLVLGVIFTAVGSKGRFWIDECKDMGWFSYTIGLAIMTICAPYWVAEGFIEEFKKH